MKRYYDGFVEPEWARLEKDLHGRVHYEVTKHMILKHLPKGGLVWDAGCGPGRYAVDLTNPAKLREAVKNIHRIGLIDILVNNAGFDRPGTTAKIDKQGFEAVLSIHVTVPLMLIQILLPDMCKAGWGRIINVSSIY